MGSGVDYARGKVSTLVTPKNRYRIDYLMSVSKVKKDFKISLNDEICKRIINCSSHVKKSSLNTLGYNSS